MLLPEGNRSSARSAITQFREDIIATSRHLSSSPRLFLFALPRPPFSAIAKRNIAVSVILAPSLASAPRWHFSFAPLFRANFTESLRTSALPGTRQYGSREFFRGSNTDQVRVSTCTRPHANPHPRAFFFASSRRANEPLGRSLSPFSSRKFARRELRYPSLENPAWISSSVEAGFPVKFQLRAIVSESQRRRIRHRILNSGSAKPKSRPKASIEAPPARTGSFHKIKSNKRRPLFPLSRSRRLFGGFSRQA